ncbi:hypothetical protein OsJ_13733 [Oryza sativa Japonica Group]|uniref:Transcription factor MYC/MYB N-terminal domain-containing protein n=1 Tax=Oryza sativa subsp. japonica TaxID=39947 RepID=B9FDK6_ORYSJ|nr:hypothetical protein OsJ_13733 [Oryza sativa Japonica Group]
MMALHEALRNVCLNSDWTYSVFWTIRPRPRCRGGNGCKVGDDNGSLMLMWEDGFCRPRVAECLEDIDGRGPRPQGLQQDVHPALQLRRRVGAGLMGKVASDKCHKWVFKEPSECEPNIANYWQSSFDATIAVIQAGHGLLQLGSCKIIPEDLHFVLRMRHMFESLGYQSGFFLSQLFSSSRGTSPSPSSFPLKQQQPPPPQLFNWPGHAPPQLPPGASPLFPPGPAAFHPSSRPMPPFPGGGKDESHLFHLPPAAAAKQPQHMDEHHHHQQQPMAAPQQHGGKAPEGDLKWPQRAVVLHRAHRPDRGREVPLRRRRRRRRGRREQDGGGGAGRGARRRGERGGVPEPGEPLQQGEEDGERPEHQVQEELHVAGEDELVHHVDVPVGVGVDGAGAAAAAARDGVQGPTRGRRLLGPNGDVLGVA